MVFAVALAIENKRLIVGESLSADVSFDPGLVTGDIDEDVQQIERTLTDIDNRVELVYIEPKL